MGKFQSYAEAAKHYNLVNRHSLCSMFKQKRSFVPPKRGCMDFSFGEEESIIEEFVKRNNGDRNYNKNLLIRVFVDKIRTLRLSNPERNFSKYVTEDGKFKKSKFTELFVWRMAKRFDLEGIGRTEQEQKFYCELCEKKYTLKNTLTKHLKEVHFL